MKYIFSFILLFIAFVAVSSSAYAMPTVTRVRGNIYDLVNGGGINGLTVTVNCDGVVKTAGTDSHGLYVIDFTLAECAKFRPVTSSVTHSGQPQAQTVYVSSDNTATLDFYFGAVSVPEFGAIGGIITAIGSGLAFYGLRRKIV